MDGCSLLDSELRAVMRWPCRVRVTPPQLPSINQDSRKQKSGKEVVTAGAGADPSVLRRAMHAMRVVVQAGRSKLRLR
jgi:hypothetical protein